MPIDRKAMLPQDVKETVRKRIDELTEELKAKYDVGFRPGVYIVYTADGEELPDGLWVLFPQNTDAEFAFGLIEAGYGTMKKFIQSGILKRSEIIRRAKAGLPPTAPE
jgi:hypothetical protein